MRVIGPRVERLETQVTNVVTAVSTSQADLVSLTEGLSATLQHVHDAARRAAQAAAAPTSYLSSLLGPLPTSHTPLVSLSMAARAQAAAGGAGSLGSYAPPQQPPPVSGQAATEHMASWPSSAQVRWIPTWCKDQQGRTLAHMASSNKVTI